MNALREVNVRPNTTSADLLRKVEGVAGRGSRCSDRTGVRPLEAAEGSGGGCSTLGIDIVASAERVADEHTETLSRR